MPELYERKLVCDRPKCGKAGRAYVLDDGRKPKKTILCPTHSKPIDEAMTWGVPAPMTRARRSRGLSEERLASLIVDD